MALESRYCEACGNEIKVASSATAWHNSCPQRQIRKPAPRYLPSKAPTSLSKGTE